MTVHIPFSTKKYPLSILSELKSGICSPSYVTHLHRMLSEMCLLQISGLSAQWPDHLALTVFLTTKHHKIWGQDLCWFMVVSRIAPSRMSCIGKTPINICQMNKQRKRKTWHPLNLSQWTHEWIKHIKRPFHGINKNNNPRSVWLCNNILTTKFNLVGVMTLIKGNVL